jgi:hypothetical protein
LGNLRYKSASVGRWHEFVCGPAATVFLKPLYRDAYGVVFDTSVDEDIGNPCDWPIKDPRDLEGYQFSGESGGDDGRSPFPACRPF